MNLLADTKSVRRALFALAVLGLVGWMLSPDAERPARDPCAINREANIRNFQIRLDTIANTGSGQTAEDLQTVIEQLCRTAAGGGTPTR